MKWQWLVVSISVLFYILFVGCGDSANSTEIPDAGSETSDEDKIEGRCEFSSTLLNKPTGDYCVGTTDVFTLVDEKRTDILSAANPQGPREILVQLWYPVNPGFAGEKAAYLEESIARDLITAFAGFPIPDLDGFQDEVETHSYLDAPLALNTRRFPVVLFSPGYDGVYQIYHALIEDLASHGFVVIAMNHPHISGISSYPDGRPIETLDIPVGDSEYLMEEATLEHYFHIFAEDLAFAIDYAEMLDQKDSGEFENRLDLSRIGAYGHSYGGATAFESCAKDARCLAAIDIDGSLYGDVAHGGADKPLLAILSDEGIGFENVLSRMKVDTYQLTIAESSHYSFTDLGLIFPQIAPSVMELMEVMFGMQFNKPELMLEITRAYVRAFFQVNLERAADADLNDLAEHYAEQIDYKTFQPNTEQHVLNEPNLTWVSIPAGEFEMGCALQDETCEGDELPRHAVTIEAFEMTAQMITSAQYEAVTGVRFDTFSCEEDCPVDGADYVAAEAYCQLVGGRLPSESEWEYAARAGTVSVYPCGDDPSCLDDIAWYEDNSEWEPHPVAEKQANSFGQYDMMGNLWEWVTDCYHPSFDGAPSTQAAWDNDSCETGPVLRGGAFFQSAGYLRSSNRTWAYPGGVPGMIGFRCVREDYPRIIPESTSANTKVQ